MGLWRHKGSRRSRFGRREFSHRGIGESREDPGRTMMRRTIRMVAVSMLGAVAITPMPARSADGQAITLYTDPASGQVYTKRCKHCVRLGEYIPAGSTEEIEIGRAS